MRLVPLFQVRRRIGADQSLDFERRYRRLSDIDRQIRDAGLSELTRLLERVCAARCQARSTDHPLDGEEFASQVVLLTLDKIADYDVRAARFSTWLSRTVLPQIYSAMQREINPAWGRPAPKTDRGDAQRQQVHQLANAASLDAPVPGTERTTLADTAADRRPTAEAEVLEGQCRGYFLQAVGRLNEPERILLRRTYVEQESQKAIADSLGVSAAAVSVQLKKVHRKLFDLLGLSFQEECADTQFCESLRCRE